MPNINVNNVLITGGITFISEIVTTTGDPYWSNVSLLMNNTTTNNQTNNTFLDESTNNFTVTRAGSVTQGSVTPFTVATNTSYSATTNGGSGTFSSNNYLSVADNEGLELGSGDFTIEAWVFVTSFVSNSAIISKGGSASPYLIFIGASNEISFYSSGNGSTWNIVQDLRFATNPATNTWHHIAVTRSGNTFRTFFNGVLANSVTASGTTFNNAQPVLIGRYVADFNGRISSLRIVKGTAVYTGNFTPSTTPLTAISGTSLLLNYTNGGVYDATTKNNLVTLANSKVSTTTSKFSTASVYFDGSSAINIPVNTALQFVSGDFTMEGWIYRTSSKLQNIITQDDGISVGQAFQFRLNASNSLDFVYWKTSDRASFVARTTTNTVSVNTWTHVAVSKSGNTLKIFIDGTQGYSGTESAMYQNALITTLGGFTSGLNGQAFTGYMQDVRITKGVGRYTSNFTPPTQPFLTY